MNFTLRLVRHSLSVILGIVLIVVAAAAEQLESHIVAAQEYQKRGDLVRGSGLFGPNLAWVCGTIGPVGPGGCAVKRKRFSVEQITVVLQQVSSGMPVGDVCRQVGISEQTFYRWKKEYAGMLPSEARELKQFRDENLKLKRLVADLSLDKVMLQDVVQKTF